MTKPQLPHDHVLRPYADYMLERIDQITLAVNVIFWLVIIAIIVLGILVVVFSAFSYLKYLEWEELRAYKVAVQKQTAATNLLLETVKSWTVVHVEEERKRVEATAQAVEDIKAIVPEATATRVMEKIEEKGSDGPHSGILKSTPPSVPGT